MESGESQDAAPEELAGWTWYPLDDLLVCPLNRHSMRLSRIGQAIF
jgi:hypothetical protein